MYETDINIIFENGPIYCNILVGKAPFLVVIQKPILSISPERSEMRRLINDPQFIASIFDKEEIKQIVKIQLNGLIKMLSEQDIKIEYTEDLIEALAEKGYDPQFGARPVKRVIQKEVLNELSKEILSGRITSTSHILLDAFDDKIVFRNK